MTRTSSSCALAAHQAEGTVEATTFYQHILRVCLGIGALLAGFPLGLLTLQHGLITFYRDLTSPNTTTFTQEWLRSGVHPDLIALNVSTPDPDEALEFILGHELDRLKLNNPAQVSAEARRLLDRYQHLEQGGWLCEGVDPATGTKMGWGCFKPTQPRTLLEFKGFGTQPPDPTKTKTKTIKYEAPKGVAKRVFCLAVSWQVGLGIALTAGLEQAYRNRMGDADPSAEDVGFWPWAIAAGITQTYAEGAKKAASLLSHGILAIGLDGVENWSQPRLEGETSRQLKTDIQVLTAHAPQVVIAHDQDTKPDTVANVTHATQSFAAALEAVGCSVSVALWNPGLGKGIDDVWLQGGDVRYLLSHTFPWQTLKHIRKHFALPRADLTLHLESLEGTVLPEGDLAIRSPKGTGKTRWAAETLRDEPKVIALNFRTSLCEDQSTRLGLDFLNESDMGAGHIISPDGSPTQRITLNLDSLLKLRSAIERGDWDGCVVFLDEFEQALRHLLQGNTVRQGGKLPLILETFATLMQRAGRVIAADADLSQAAVDYLEALSGRTFTTVLNLSATTGYAFTQFSHKAALIARLQAAALEGKRLFVATTSKRESKRLAELLNRLGLEGKYLLRNSETSGQTRDYSANPSQWLLDHPEVQVVICSPTDATGISIECLNRFDVVALVGLPGGQTDAELAQMLERVRQKLERWIWTAAKGGRVSPVSSSTHPLEVKSALQRQTDLASQVLNHSLCLNHDAHLEAWAQVEAKTNYAMQHLGLTLDLRLHLEGNRKLETVELEGTELRAELKEIAHQVKHQEQMTILNAARLSETEAKVLERKEVLSPDEAAALFRFKLCQFYCIPSEALCLEDIQRDREGRTRSQIINLECFLNPARAKALDLEAITLGRHLIERQHCHLLDSTFLHQIDLEPFLVPGAEWDTDDPRLHAIHRYVMDHLEEARDAGLRVHQSDSPQAVLGTILGQLGLKTKRFGKPTRRADGSRIYRYKLEEAHQAVVLAILERRSHTAASFAIDQKNSQGCDDLKPLSQGHQSNYPVIQWDGYDWYLGYRGTVKVICSTTLDPDDPECWLILPVA